MKTSKLIAIVAATGLLAAGVGGGAAWWTLHGRTARESAAGAASAPAPVDKRPTRYVSLEKVIVMLRHAEGDTSVHYLAVDLVLKTHEEQEKTVKDDLPMLRSVALQALSVYTPDKAGAMSIDEVAKVVNTAFADAYVRDQHDKPFSDALIGKLIIE